MINVREPTCFSMQLKVSLLQVYLSPGQGVLKGTKLRFGLVEAHHNALPLLFSNCIFLVQILVHRMET